MVPVPVDDLVALAEAWTEAAQCWEGASRAAEAGLRKVEDAFREAANAWEMVAEDHQRTVDAWNRVTAWDGKEKE